MQNWAFILGGKPAPLTGGLMQPRTAKLQGSEMNWDDIRYVVALYREGSISAVARQFRVDKTTVTRRLKAMEGQLGTTLFERTRPPDSNHWPGCSGQSAGNRGVDCFAGANFRNSREEFGVVRVTALSPKTS
jgi:hypothetical protein